MMLMTNTMSPYLKLCNKYYFMTVIAEYLPVVANDNTCTECRIKPKSLLLTKSCD